MTGVLETEQDPARMSSAKSSPAALRNRDPILGVLRERLPQVARVLEIASGTGEHAYWFARHLPGVIWQPSDIDPEARASVEAYRREAALSNLRPVLAIDASEDSTWPKEQVNAIVSINMIHVSPARALEGLVRNAARLLLPSGILFLYGPFRFSGTFLAESNAEFDAALRARDPRWGVRDLDEMRSLTAQHGFGPPELVALPANNHAIIFERPPAEDIE
jgi:SAM-dependent methyltransferase